MLTMMRDIRDNFEVEIWQGLGIKSNSVFANIDAVISVIVLIAVSLLILVKKNIFAFKLIHLMIIGGCILAGVSTVLFDLKLIWTCFFVKSSLLCAFLILLQKLLPILDNSPSLYS